MEQFSLFEGDFLFRLCRRIGIRGTGVWYTIQQIAVVLLVTWVPGAIGCWYLGFIGDVPDRMNFFGDVATFAQAFIGLPLFLIAQNTINGKTVSAAEHFKISGAIPEEHHKELKALNAKIARLRKSAISDYIIIFIAYLCSYFWLMEEIHNGWDTWHAIGAPQTQTPTFPGWWVAMVGIPVFNYLWLRWIWKIQLWCFYLFEISKFKLRIIASHPDRTGGIGFLSDTQKSFAILIFAFGIGAIAPLVGYKIETEGASLFSFSVGGPLLGFLFGAPIFFTVPLLMFTKQLKNAKKNALEAYSDKATQAAIYFEETWLHARGEKKKELLFGDHLQGMNNLNVAYESIHRMRVVPFDMKSITHLFGSTIGSLLPLVMKIPQVPESLKPFLELLKKLL